jgi:tryptophan-specific transport protein
MGILVGALSKVTGSTNLDYLLQVFSHLAVATSFLGVTLGLFDCIADTLGFDDSRLGRTKTAIVTFVPPAIGGLFYPDGFIMAIGFAGLAATVFAVIVPAMMALATRRKFGNTTYRAPGGNVMLYVTIAYGITVAICHVLTMFDMLPVYGK